MSVGAQPGTSRQLPWYKEATKSQWKSLIAAGSGWAMDAFDVMIYSLVIVSIMKEFSLNTAVGGMLASLTLLSSAFGGMMFGVIADKFGRTKALMASILLYSIFTAACGLAQDLQQLIVFRILLGLGMGGEWASGAALITESWPARHRAKAMGLVQSSWTIGYAFAALASMIIVPQFGWRMLFFVGILPALVTFWIRRNIEEPEIWQNQKKAEASGGKTGIIAGYRILFSRPYLKNTICLAMLLIFAQFGYWGIFTWVPGFLGSPVEQGGAGLNIVKSGVWIIAMQVGGFAGLVSFGFFADKIGRKKAFIIYFAMAAFLIPFYAFTKDPTILLILGPFVTFFGQGHFSGCGPIMAEIYPTKIRATAQGFLYNFGRGVSALGPVAVGALALSKGLGSSLAITSIAFILGIVAMFFLPETKGKELD